MISSLPQVDRSWTLFLDRDGVINHEKHMDYVLHYGEFQFYDGVLEAMKIFAQTFGRIVLVTNQRGVSKGLMTELDLHHIHEHMSAEITAAGGRMDAMFYATSLDDDHPDRKPQTGMALRAKAQFPEIDFEKSIMIGNNLSDMAFGRNAGMFTVFLTTTNPEQELPHTLIDHSSTGLLKFATELTKS
jgi:D-glycero-D-manno-heptose 1,7-bisphosphate phosphatase